MKITHRIWAICTLSFLLSGLLVGVLLIPPQNAIVSAQSNSTPTPQSHSILDYVLGSDFALFKRLLTAYPISDWDYVNQRDDINYLMIRIDHKESDNIIVWVRNSYATEPMTIAEVEALIDDEWIDKTMIGYDSWDVAERCVIDNKVFLAIDNAVFQDREITYTVYLWYWHDGISWNQLSILFDPANEEPLANFAEDIMQIPATCNDRSN